MKLLNSMTAKTAVALLFVAAVIAIAIYPSVAAQSPKKFTIIVTDKGMSISPTAPSGGNYLLVVKNHTKQPRGVLMTGEDKAGSPYVRYSKILPSGAYETFRWYFPRQETVYIQDLLSCTRESNGCVKTTVGSFRKSVKFK